MKATTKPFLVAVTLLCLAGCGSSGSNGKGSSGGNSSGSGSVAPAITTQPSPLTVTAGQSATFTVAAKGTPTPTYQWQKNSTNISGASQSSYTIASTTTSDAGSYQVLVSNTAGTVTSNSVSLTVDSAPGSPAPSSGSSVSVLTYHNDNSRTGQNLNETTLTTTNVNSATFGQIGVLQPLSGLVDAEPLYAPNLTISGGTHNVVFVATEGDQVYAFDADTFTQLWSQSLLVGSETPSDEVDGCGQVAPQIGVTSTPVIDLAAGAHGTIFLVAMSKDSSGNYHQRLHALDITTGAELTGSPVQIEATYTIPGSGGKTTAFDPTQYEERSGLLLSNSVIYLSWTSHCDSGAYQGWIMGYNEPSLQQTTVLDVTPNGSEGAIWMAGDGPAADSSGNIYFLDANGTFDTPVNASGLPPNGDYGNAFIKLSSSGGALSVADYFAMSGTVNESNSDEDLGSGGVILLPDQTDSSGNVWQLAVGAGKDSNMYIVNRNNMGKFNASNDNAIYQEIDGVLGGGVWSVPAYFNGVVYYGPNGNNLMAFPISNAKLATTPSTKSPSSFGYPGATPSISANGTSNGIVWAIQNGSTGALHAYDAMNLANELYNSNQAGSRDQFSDNSNDKFVTPMIANGKVYVGTPNAVIVFGLLNQSTKLHPAHRPSGGSKGRGSGADAEARLAKSRVTGANGF
jgi:Immunoglobulin domain